MVNPGAFLGSRKDFLMSKKAEYSDAVKGKYVADALAKIHRQYLKRYPIDLPHKQEPEESFLAAVDDDAPDPEPEEPNAETMSESEYKAAMADSKDRKDLLKFQKKQITRWLDYQYIKDNNIRSQETGSYMPYTSLVKQLSGKDVVRPRQKTPTNLWRKTERERIENHLKGEIELQQRLGRPIPNSHLTSTRDRIARELFSELDEETQRKWRAKALAEHSEALKKYKEQIHSDPSMDPADLQMAIQGLVQFAQPILDAISLVTGWKVTMLAGGPEPARGGRLSVISIHSGYTSGDIKMTYGRAERARYIKYVVPSFGSFLKLCYSPEECRARALLEEEGFMPMSSYEHDTDETTFHDIEPDVVKTHSQNKDTQAQVPVHPPTSSTAASSSQSGNVPTTQDSMTSDANPFPDEELSDDDEMIFSRAVSPLPSAPPSPACSHHPSPAPLSPTSQHSESVPGTTTKSAVVQSTLPTSTATAPSAITHPSNPSARPQVPTPSATPIATAPSAVTYPSNPSASPQVQTLGKRTVPTPSVTVATTHSSNTSASPQVPTPLPVPSNPSGLTAAAAALKDADKDGGCRKPKKRTAVPMEVAEPVSKRARTKTMHAIASEEQSGGRKKREAGKKATGTQVRGKENGTGSSNSKRGASSGKGKQG